MATTKEQQTQDSDDFAAQFAADDIAPKQRTDNEEFGLAPGEGGDAAAPTVAAAGADEKPEPAAAAQEEGQDDTAAIEQKRLQEWEANLRAKEDELAARELASQTSSVTKTETGNEKKEPGAGGEEESPAEGDPETALAEDFGPEFVSLLKQLIQKCCMEHVGKGVGEVSATVDSLIRDLRAERETNHFKRIRDAHDDFEELTQTPEFSDWQKNQPPDQQAHLARVIESGSADEIITMLTQFKQDKQGSASGDEHLEAAEGVRSNSLKLPAEPDQDKGYLAAWNAA